MLREGKRLIDGSGTEGQTTLYGLEDVNYLESMRLVVDLEKQKITKKVRSVIREIERFRSPGLKSLELESMAHIFALHQELYYESSHPLSIVSLPTYHFYDKAYWYVNKDPDYKSISESAIQVEIDGQNLSLWCGLIQFLNLGFIAQIVDMSTHIYARELLQTSEVAEKIALGTLSASGKKVTGKNYERLQLRYRQQLEAELLLAMMHSFRDDYLVALVIASHQGKKYIVGSMGAMRGSGEKSLRETKIEAGAPQIHPSLLSSLPTQAALSFAYNQDGEELADLPESSLAEITRLNVVSADLLKQVASEADRATVSASLMMIIHEGIARNWPDVSHEIFNTQPALHRVLRKHGLPVKIISEPNSIQPTTVVGETIHGVYFKKKPPIPQSLSVAAACVVAEQFFQQLSNNQ